MRRVCLGQDILCMHKKSSGARAYIPYATHMLQWRYTSTSYMPWRIPLKAEARRVHPSPQEISMHAKMFFFLAQTHMGAQRLILCVRRSAYETCLRHLSNTELGAMKFRHGKNFTSSDIRTRVHVI